MIFRRVMQKAGCVFEAIERICVGLGAVWLDSHGEKDRSRLDTIVH